ncbi:MAG TPA: amidohydrolase family protein [Vicinamibacterales bacterium]|nr:amidohydrolase family protein [Vicinamibacterales bacterium]
MTLNDAHVHFFSSPFFSALGGDAALATLQWNAPGSADALADRWVAELDRHGVSRAAIIASIPGDAESVGAAVRRHPSRFVGMIMVDPTQANAAVSAAYAIDRDRLRGICLYPAMHRYPIHDERARKVIDVAAARPGTVVFVHCGVLSVGVRKKLGLPSPFDLRFSNPVDLHAIALAYPATTFIVPHFGAGYLREALMLADLCPNVVLDTSSSNAWIRYHPGLTLRDVFRDVLAVAGPDRVLFGSDSSFFPRGWVANVHEQQSTALDDINASAEVREKIFGANFDRVFA